MSASGLKSMNGIKNHPWSKDGSGLRCRVAPKSCASTKSSKLIPIAFAAANAIGMSFEDLVEAQLLGATLHRKPDPSLLHG